MSREAEKNKVKVSRNRSGSHLFDLKDITRDNFGSFDFGETTVAENDSLESERLLQFFDNGTSLEFLNETDASVEQQETADNTEIHPVLETSSKNSGGLVTEKKVQVR
jgi:hypothetical protein